MKKRILSVILSLALCLGLCPPMAFAEETSLDVSQNSVVIGTDGDYTITGTTTTNTITVNSNVTANITLNNVSIDVSAISDAAAFKIADDSAGNVSVTLVGTNTLKSGAGCAGLQKNGGDGTGTLTIDGTGSLTATGGSGDSSGGAGIGGGNKGSAANITIAGGNITASGGTDGAGIGCGRGGDSKTRANNITISGGTVKATGGEGSYKSGGGAGIGSGYSSSADNITISGGNVTATGGEGCYTYGTTEQFGGAGIGGGYGDSGGTIQISGGTVNATGSYSAAGIGGTRESNGNTTKITITGGTVTAKGGKGKGTANNGGGAGIGGGAKQAATVTISGGTVTATGGNSIGSTNGGAGIGQGGGSTGTATFSTGTDGNAWIIAKGGAGGSSGGAPGEHISNGGNTSGWSAVIFEDIGIGAVIGSAYGNVTLDEDREIPDGYILNVDGTLTVNSTLTNNGVLLVMSNGTLTGNGTLDGNGTFETDNVTEDMIVVDPVPAYNGKDRSADIAKNVKLRIMEHDFEIVKIEGQPSWTLGVAPKAGSVSDYTVTYTQNLPEQVQGTPRTAAKDVTLGKSGTNITATSDKKDYEYGDTVTINATVTPSGEAPAMLADAGDTPKDPEHEPGWVAVYKGDTFLVAANAGSDGTYGIHVPSRKLGAGTHTLTVKYNGTDYMAEATVNVSVKVAECPHTNVANGVCTVCGEAIVAEVTIGGVTTRYTDITSAWNYANGKTAEIILMANATVSDSLVVPIGTDITLEMADGVVLDGTGNVTVSVEGSFTLRSGTITNSGSFDCALSVSPSPGNSATLTMTGGTVERLEASGDYTVSLGGGTISNSIQVWGATLGDLLADGYGYRKTDGTWVTGDALTGTKITDEVEVKPIPVKVTAQPTAPAAVEYGYTNAPTLTVAAEATGSDTNITYQWYKVAEDGTATKITGVTDATAATYSPTGLGAGEHKFYCAVTCDGYTVNSEAATVTVNKKELTPTITGTTEKVYDGTTAAPAGLAITLTGVVNGDTVTASASSYTYNSPNVKDAKTITASGITLSGEAKDNYTLSSNTATVDGKITKADNVAAPVKDTDFTVDYAKEELTLTKNDCEVYTATDSTGTKVTSSSISDFFGKNLFIRKVEDDNHAASEWMTIALTARPELTGVDAGKETLKGKADGTITGLTALMEIDQGKGWEPAPSGNLENLASGKTVKVRVKATESAPASEITTYTIAEGASIKVTFNQGDQTATGMPAEQTDLSYNDKITKPSNPTATNTDYEFVGWFHDKTEWDFNTPLTQENITLTAKWKQVKFNVSGTVQDDHGTLVQDAKVVLKQGNKEIESGTSKENGTFEFQNSVPIGAYNVVTTYAGQTKTSLVTITNKDETLEVKLPPEGVNSTLTITGSNTPAVVVGGLDEEATELKKDQDVEKVTVSMSVEAKPETSMDEAAVTAIKAQAAATPVLEYLDVVVKATIAKVTGTEEKTLPTTTNIMTLVVPFDFDGKENVTVYHYDKTSGKAVALGTGTAGAGNYQIDKTNGLIYIYAQEFSPYVIGYSAAFTITFDTGEGATSSTQKTKPDGTLGTLPTDPTRNGYTFQGWYTERGEKVTESTVFKADTTVTAKWTQNTSTPGGTTAPSTPTVNVTIDGDKQGGKVEASQNSITITPEKGYKIAKITVNGREVSIPASNILKGLQPTDKVVVTFAKIPANPVSERFTDVKAGAWYEDAVQFAVDKGLFLGTSETTFAPDNPMNRGMLATVLYRLAEKPDADPSNLFNDVAGGEYYAEAVAWAASKGVISGYGNGKFGPNDNITREQLAAMLWRYAGKPAAANKSLSFNDAAQTSDWALDAMCWAVENGIVNGYGNGRLDPKGQATRAQVAQMLMRYVNITQE